MHVSLCESQDMVKQRATKGVVCVPLERRDAGKSKSIQSRGMRYYADRLVWLGSSPTLGRRD